MRRVLVLIILALILGSLPVSSAKGVPEPERRDVFLYQYFSRVLVRLDYSLRYALVGDNYSLQLANLTLGELQLIMDESLYYRERGVNATVMEVIPPFYDLASETVILVRLLLEFRENPTPALASGILTTVGEMERTLDSIDLMKLRNGTKVLTFNTARLRLRLEEIRKLISEVPGEPEGFVLGVSDRSPILNQTVTIFGSCPGNSSVTVVVEGINSTHLILVYPKNGLFSTGYRFERPGNYTVYAVQGEERSNSVRVTARKIPSLFVVSDLYTSFLNGTVNLSGRLVDHYGNPLAGRRITVGNATLLTGSDGGFWRVYFSPVATSFRVLLRFNGDSIHAGTARKVTVKFERYPVSITLEGPQEVVLGKAATFTGTVEPSLPVEVYVNGTRYATLTPENGTFSFRLRPNGTGEFEVYAAFPGNERYEKARSNVVVLKVIPPEDRTLRYVAIGLLSLLLVAFAVLGTRGARGGKTSSPQEVIVERSPSGGEIVPEIPGDVGEAYDLLRRRLRDAMGIGESLTPREVLKVLADWELYPRLETVTKLHEKAVYGGMPLSDEEMESFMKAMEKLLRGVEA
ncbi:DUF4129 domain-containing protein [Thermococcus sp.]|uniref:DUF4129 domain-containing protein n=1 Tax=Thermococcus sp. TaxID=35749 RepID=UPI00261B3B1C|nr:DUF4129 domain-containing protein [Thermococcus sp.]